MILLDTNILSELMRPKPEPKVVLWLDAQPETEIWMTANLTLATRNVKDFSNIGKLKIINPWGDG